MGRAARTAVTWLPLLCAGCSTQNYWLIHPRGPVAQASLDAWIVDTAATFLVIGPATLLVMWAIWRYRRAINRGRYAPNFAHSVPLEATFWGAPLVIVLALGLYALKGAFATDPSGPGVMANGVSPDGGKPPVNIDVVTTDWQWLFIYPDHHVAAANELVLPVHTPIRFRLTSSTVATDFFIPQLSGQIDVMPGMRTWQGLIANHVGTYEGFASDYNGPGFSWMRFQARVVSPADFAAWEQKAAQSSDHLDQARFMKFAQPTINRNQTTTEFSAVEDNLFDHVMGNVMMGQTFPTPPNMTEKKAGQVNGGKQQLSALPPGKDDDQ